MPSDLTELTITEAVERTFDSSTDERFRQVFVSLVRHLHDFARKARLTGEECFTAMDFLERVAEGSASIVASGPKPAFDDAEPYLRVIAPRVTYCGAEEQARLLKLCHNLMLGVVTQALAEAMALAEKGGVPASTFVDFLDGSVLGCTHFRHKGHAIQSRTFEAAATTENLRKDFDLGLAAARELEVPMPVGALTHQLLQAAVGLGYGKSDYVSLYQVAATAAGLTTS